MDGIVSCSPVELPDDLCDSFKIPRGTQIKITTADLKRFIAIPLPDHLCDSFEVPRGTHTSYSEMDRLRNNFLRDYNVDPWHMITEQDKWMFKKDEMMRKLFSLRALTKVEAYPITDELSDLLEIYQGAEMTRFDVQNHVEDYLHKKNLIVFDKKDHSIKSIKLDDGKFCSIFSIPMGLNELSYRDLVMSVLAYFVEKVQFAHTLKGPCMDSIFMISDQLADFLEVSHGTQMSVAEAVRQVAKYTFANSLQIWNGKKNSFILDDKLVDLFSLEIGAEDHAEERKITYDRIEKLLSKLFIGSA